VNGTFGKRDRLELTQINGIIDKGKVDPLILCPLTNLSGVVTALSGSNLSFGIESGCLKEMFSNLFSKPLDICRQTFHPFFAEL